MWFIRVCGPILLSDRICLKNSNHYFYFFKIMRKFIFSNVILIKTVTFSQQGSKNTSLSLCAWNNAAYVNWKWIATYIVIPCTLASILLEIVRGKYVKLNHVQFAFFLYTKLWIIKRSLHKDINYKTGNTVNSRDQNHVQFVLTAFVNRRINLYTTCTFSV